jgi:hypothetical protein
VRCRAYDPGLYGGFCGDREGDRTCEADTGGAVGGAQVPAHCAVLGRAVAADNTIMYFGDGKKAVLDLIAAIREG